MAGDTGGSSAQANSGGDASGYVGAVVEGANFLSGIVTSAQNVHNMRQERRIRNRREDSAHQREMEDLRKAGLNPILAAGKGGSQSGMTSAAQISNPMEGVAERYSKNQPLQNELLRAQIRDVNSASALKNAQTVLTMEEKALKAGQGMALQPEIDTYQERKEAIQEHLRQIRLLNSHSAYDLDRAKAESSFNKGVGGKIAPWAKLLPNVNPILMKGIGGKAKPPARVEGKGEYWKRWNEKNERR